MGNTASNKVPETVGGAYSPTARDENVYDQSFPPGPPTSRYTASSQTQSPPSYASLRVSPPVPPRMDRRSYTVTSRPEKHSDSPVRKNQTQLLLLLLLFLLLFVKMFASVIHVCTHTVTCYTQAHAHTHTHTHSADQSHCVTSSVY